MLQIVLKGRIPSKKNSKMMVCRGSRPMLLPSANYTAWQKEQSLCLKGLKPVVGIESISIVFYAPDKRPTDLTNKAESIMDLLVDNGIIEDDNWFVVPSVTLSFGGVDKDDPRAVITIS